jgi:hypothetical protein
MATSKYPPPTGQPITASTDIRQRAISLLETLSNDKLPQAVEFLESLSQSPQADPTVIPIEEMPLLQTINRRLSPTERQRLDYLRLQLETEMITELERQELLKLSDRLEQQDAERAEALFQLAQLRRVNFAELLQEFLPSLKSI